ncbi:MAG: hypothetical protein WD226_09380 [Planctomycetota bacterium]
MEGGALLSDWWVEFSKDVVPYLNVTTRLEDSSDTHVFGQIGGTGFPTTVFMDHTGAVLTDSWMYPGELKTLEEAKAEALENLAELDELRAQAAKNPDDKAAQGALKLALALRHSGSLTREEFEAIAKLNGVPRSLVERYRTQLLVEELEAAQKVAGESATSREEFTAAVGEAFYAIFKSGKRLPIDHEMATGLYGYAMDHALEIGDGATAEAAFLEFEKAMNLAAEENPDAKERIDAQVDEKRQAVKSMVSGGAK